MYTRYREAVTRQGLTDYEVAKRAGIPTSTLYMWRGRVKESPDAKLGGKNAVKLAKFLGIPLEEFMAEEGEA